MCSVKPGLEKSMKNAGVASVDVMIAILLIISSTSYVMDLNISRGLLLFAFVEGM